MARPLTKKTAEGASYQRPPPIDASIDATIGLTDDALRHRLGLRRRDPGYVPSEVLVHLLRDARRSRDDPRFFIVYRVLVARCASTLKAQSMIQSLSDPAAVIDEIIDEFSVRLAQDGRADSSDELDYYEVRFDNAFRVFWLRCAAKELKRARHESHVAVGAGEGESATEDEGLSSELERPAIQDHFGAERRELLRKIDALPEPNRTAYVLTELLGHTQDEAAELCKCTDRTIRNRLAAARSALAGYVPEDIP